MTEHTKPDVVWLFREVIGGRRGPWQASVEKPYTGNRLWKLGESYTNEAIAFPAPTPTEGEPYEKCGVVVKATSRGVSFLLPPCPLPAPCSMHPTEGETVFIPLPKATPPRPGLDGIEVSPAPPVAGDAETKDERERNVGEWFVSEHPNPGFGFDVLVRDGEGGDQPIAQHIPTRGIAEQIARLRSIPDEETNDCCRGLAPLDACKCSDVERVRELARSTPEAEDPHREPDLFLAIMLAVEADVAKGRARWKIADELKSVIRRTRKLTKDLAATPPETGDEP